MNELRSILVHLGASTHNVARLRLAHVLAEPERTHITALYAVEPAALQAAYGLGEGSALAWTLGEQLDHDRRASARRLFERERGDANPMLTWADLGTRPPVQGFAEQAWCADLMVLGQAHQDDKDGQAVPAEFVESVILASGRPALVVPAFGDHTSLGQTVLVAWKRSREAAHAMSSAMPLLRSAKTVHLLLPGSAQEAGAPVEGGLDPIGWLAAHGVTPEIHRGVVDADHPGESLLSVSADLGADLLVMGCYGHNRAREWALGGATRSVLRAMTLPVWMAH